MPPTLRPSKTAKPLLARIAAVFRRTPEPIHFLRAYAVGGYPALWCGANIYSRSAKIMNVRDYDKGEACEDCIGARHSAAILREIEKNTPGMSYSDRRAAAFAKRYGCT